MKVCKFFTFFMFLIIFLLSSLQEVFSNELPWSTVEQIREKTVLRPIKEIPEWDGVYIATKEGYIEFPKESTTTIEPNIVYIEINQNKLNPIVIPLEKFQGFLIKGDDILKTIHIFRAKNFSSTQGSYLGIGPKKEYLLDLMKRKTISPGVYLYAVEEPETFFKMKNEDIFYIGIALKIDRIPTKVFCFGLKR